MARQGLSPQIHLATRERKKKIPVMVPGEENLFFIRPNPGVKTVIPKTNLGGNKSE